MAAVRIVTDKKSWRETKERKGGKMLGSGMNLVTTVIGFGMSLTFIVFICARLICSRIRSATSQAAAFHVELRSDVDPVGLLARLLNFFFYC